MAGSVLCAVDDSPVADEVIRVAARLKERLGLRLVIAHAVPPTVPTTVPLAGATAPYAYPYPPVGDVSGAGDESRDAAHAILEKIAERSDQTGGADLQPLVGDPATSLLSLAEDDEAEFLVVGSRGRGALKAALLGSVSSALAARATCPVVVVPPDAWANRADR